MSQEIERRDFLRWLGAAIVSLFAAACGPRTPATPEATVLPESTATRAAPTVATLSPTLAPTASPPAPTSPAPTSTSTPAPTSPAPTSTSTPAPTSPAPTSTPTPAPTSTPGPVGPRVAIARADSYERDLVRRQVQALLDGLGGLSDVVRPGDRVAIKVNLTGGGYFQPPAGFSAVESYMTHPEVVRALGELLYEAGAGQLFIVEAVFDPESFPSTGYVDVASELGATLVDLNGPQPYSDFARVAVGAGASIYQELTLNALLRDVDAFVSVAKLKCHYSTGVTLAMKNLIGLLPVSEYRLSPDHWWRSAAHGTEQEVGIRLPRVIVDLSLARPIHLALIDGIKTAEGGEVPRGSFAPVAPGVLIAGKNAVATDAVATAVMGFDPTANPPTAPFLRSDNHLNLAAALGLGTNRLPEIEVVGEPIDAVRFPFHPSDRESLAPWHRLPRRVAAG
jgi:uncharacterized protein (DUF362 family)